MERLTLLAENLKKKGYIVDCFENKEAATEFLNKQIDNTTVGIGGSMSIEQMELFPLLKQHNTVYWHFHCPLDMTVLQTRIAACQSKVYLASVNGISLDGTIINIDGTGNRVAALSYGPEKAYLIVGKNKIADDYEKAMWRARNVAAVLNAQRLNRKTPCVKAGKCLDCNSPERICRNFSVFYEKPGAMEYHVILVNEELGY